MDFLWHVSKIILILFWLFESVFGEIIRLISVLHSLIGARQWVMTMAATQQARLFAITTVCCTLFCARPAITFFVPLSASRRFFSNNLSDGHQNLRIWNIVDRQGWCTCDIQIRLVKPAFNGPMFSPHLENVIPFLEHDCQNIAQVYRGDRGPPLELVQARRPRCSDWAISLRTTFSVSQRNFPAVLSM